MLNGLAFCLKIAFLFKEDTLSLISVTNLSLDQESLFSCKYKKEVWCLNFVVLKLLNIPCTDFKAGFNFKIIPDVFTNISNDKPPKEEIIKR